MGQTSLVASDVVWWPSGAGSARCPANHGNRHHGPGLNQGISYLASRPGPRPAWIWILDSDVVTVRPGVLSAAVTMAREYSAALAGEPQHDAGALSLKLRITIRLRGHRKIGGEWHICAGNCG